MIQIYKHYYLSVVCSHRVQEEILTCVSLFYDDTKYVRVKRFIIAVLDCTLVSSTTIIITQ
jgi:metal-dependent HD superfamily phosphatase/phosphodiesterase